MSTMLKSENHKDLEQHRRELLDALIGQQVIHILGEPADLLRLQIRRLWQNHYRVNVVTGADAASAKIGESYFLKVDSDGNIVDSTPKITKRY
jgi:hypothetical protein